MTPFEIDIMLHYYSCCDEHEVVARNPPAWVEARTRFLSEGLLRQAVDDERKYGASYVITERGSAYCRALMAVPLPVRVWVSPQEAEALEALR